MKRSIRITAVFLVCLMLLPTLAGCASKYEEPIGECAGYEVLYEELRYVTLTYKDIFAATYGKDIWDTPESAERYRKELEDKVWDMMLNNYAVLYTCEKYMDKADMDSDVIDDAVDAQIKEAINEYGGKSEFRKAMEELHMTEHFVRFTIRVAQLENELKYVLTDDLGLIENNDEEFASWLMEDNFVYVQHIFVRNDTGESREDNRAKANAIRQQLIDGTDIADLVATAANEDLQNTSPYFLVRDVYVESLESEALSLGYIGAVSQVVETADGYYVLVRQDYSEETLTRQLPSLLASYQWARLEAMIEENRDKIAIELNEYGKSIDLLEIK